MPIDAATIAQMEQELEEARISFCGKMAGATRL